MNTNKLNNIIESLTLNYKSWILIILCIFILPTTSSNYNKFFTYIFMLLLSYWFHYASHVDETNASVHIYHHNNSNYFGHIIQILLEFVSLLFLIPFTYLLNINILDRWVMLFFYFFYTTVHNVNYSIFHVNTVHEKHHANVRTNLGPDICDIIFDTKSNNDIENTDHYILNIIVSFLIVWNIHNFWEKSNDSSKFIFKIIFGIVFSMISIIILFFTYYLKRELELKKQMRKPYVGKKKHCKEKNTLKSSKEKIKREKRIKNNKKET